MEHTLGALQLIVNEFDTSFQTLFSTSSLFIDKGPSLAEDALILIGHVLDALGNLLFETVSIVTGVIS